jgi:hypothetical protein
MPVDRTYQARWFDPRTGRWRDMETKTLVVAADGTMQLPLFPGETAMADTDWALKLR